MADPERFEVDPDPTFHDDADPDTKFFVARERTNFSFKSPTIFFQNLIKLVMCHFLSNNAGGGVRDKV